MKRGFTLIELLAVIVILAIIALIATPIVLDIIEDSKKSSIKRSVELYLDGVEQAVARYQLNGQSIANNQYYIMNTGDLCSVEPVDNKCNGKMISITVKGNKPISGIIILDNGEIKSFKNLKLNNYYVNKNSDSDELIVSNEISLGEKTKWISIENSLPPEGTYTFVDGYVRNNVLFLTYTYYGQEFLIYYYNNDWGTINSNESVTFYYQNDYKLYIKGSYLSENIEGPWIKGFTEGIFYGIAHFDDGNYYRYDPSNKNWNLYYEVPKITIDSTKATVSKFDKLYIASYGTYDNDIYYYSESIEGPWTKITSFPQEYYGIMTSPYLPYIFLSGPDDIHYYFDVETKTWQSITKFLLANGVYAKEIYYGNNYPYNFGFSFKGTDDNIYTLDIDKKVWVKQPESIKLDCKKFDDTFYYKLSGKDLEYSTSCDGVYKKFDLGNFDNIWVGEGIVYVMRYKNGNPEVYYSNSLYTEELPE